ncbi:MAG: MerR family transcriptional regulator [Chlorobi bacterium]|nr:MerR family transcriptional regulator [Chlorobiota bacterium]
MKHPAIPKLYYSIREVGELFDEQQHVLRHWEREFPILRPNKNRAGVRVYTERDLRVLRVLKVLLREEQKTIAQVRQILANGIPPEFEPIANDSTIEQRYAEKHRARMLDVTLTTDSNETITLSRADAEALLETLKHLDELFGRISQ